jgi:hypothetical protein
MTKQEKKQRKDSDRRCDNRSLETYRAVQDVLRMAGNRASRKMFEAKTQEEVNFTLFNLGSELHSVIIVCERALMLTSLPAMKVRARDFQD